VTRYVESLNGRVVKYIGDEVMAVFDKPSCVNDSSSFVARIAEIESNLQVIIGVETRVKIAIDKGSLCFLKFVGHAEIDPQGTAVDRCARIAKYTKAGAVLASAEFVKDCPKTFNWIQVGQVELKGLGAVLVYQMGEVTVDLTPVREIREDELGRLKQRLAEAEKKAQQLGVENSQLLAMNEGLQSQIEKMGSTPSAEFSVSTVDEEDSEAWDEVEEAIDDLKKLIDDAPAPPNDYARFLFLDESDSGDRYNKYERAFDQCIEANLVTEEDDNFFKLNRDHPRNKKIEEVLSRIRSKLSDCQPEEDELFEYSLNDPEFWRHKNGYYVQ
jgi:hypothetical protein